jgi:ABC-type multidrug transport system fused ATPase/permease subunit
MDVLQNYLIDKEIFNKMLNRMLLAPINLFFDTTPSGLIHKRFNQDLNTTSRDLPSRIKCNMRNYLNIIMTISFVCYNAPYCIFVIPVILVLYFFILKDFMRTTSQIGKLATAINAPLASHTSESVDGATTIRTFKKIHDFEDKQFELRDKQY